MEEDTDENREDIVEETNSQENEADTTADDYVEEA